MVARLRGPETGWSGLMMVAGATGPAEAARLRATSGDALFLVPGYGAQGGYVDPAGSAAVALDQRA